MLIFIFLTLLFSYFIKCLIYHLKLCKNMEVFPGPKPVMFLGNILDFPKKQDMAHYTLGLTQKYKGTTKLQIGPRFALLIADFEHVEFLLSSTEIIDKSRDYTFLNRWLGSGLLTATGEKWAKSRKMLNSAFKLKNLEKSLDTFNNISDIFIKKLEQYLDKDLDIASLVTHLTLDGICETAMGVQINAQSEPNSTYATKVRELGDIFIARTMSPWKFIDSLYRLTQDYKKEKKAVEYIHRFTNGIIQSRKSEYMKNEGPKETFLDLLLQAQADGGALTDERIKEEVNTFMFAGHDTTSSAISFAIFLLAMHPKAQRFAFEEVNEVLDGDNSKPITYQQLNGMKYLEMCIKETMRFFPPVPAFTRESNTDFCLPDGRIVPAGVTCIIFPAGLHYNPDIFPNPMEFNPERFTPENSARLKAHSYIPFSAGPRNCIGQKLAMIEMKTVLSKLLLSFEVSSVANYEPKLIPAMALKTQNGVWVRLQRRQ